MNNQELIEWCKDKTVYKASRRLNITIESLRSYLNGGKMTLKTAKKLSKITGLSLDEFNILHYPDLDLIKRKNNDRPIKCDMTTYENWLALLYVVKNWHKYRWRKILE